MVNGSALKTQAVGRGVGFERESETYGRKRPLSYHSLNTITTALQANDYRGSRGRFKRLGDRAASASTLFPSPI